MTSANRSGVSELGGSLTRSRASADRPGHPGAPGRALGHRLGVDRAVRPASARPTRPGAGSAAAEVLVAVGGERPALGRRRGHVGRRRLDHRRAAPARRCRPCPPTARTRRPPGAATRVPASPASRVGRAHSRPVPSRVRRRATGGPGSGPPCRRIPAARTSRRRAGAGSATPSTAARVAGHDGPSAVLCTGTPTAARSSGSAVPDRAVTLITSVLQESRGGQGVRVAGARPSTRGRWSDPVEGRRRASRCSSPSAHRASAHSRSDSRLRYRPTSEPSMGDGHEQPLGPADDGAGQVEGGRRPVGPRDRRTRSASAPGRSGSRCRSSSAVTISSVTSVVPATSLERCEGSVVTSAISTYSSRSSRVSRYVELGPGLRLGPGHAHGRLGLVDRAGHLHHGRVLGHPAAVEEAGRAVVAGPGVDLQHGVLTGLPMLNDRRRSATARLRGRGPISPGFGSPRRDPARPGAHRAARGPTPTIVGGLWPPNAPNRAISRPPASASSSSTAPWGPTCRCRSSPPTTSAARTSRAATSCWS